MNTLKICFFQNLDNTSEMFCSLMKEVRERADTFQPQLNEEDVTTLQQTTKTIQDKLDRLELNLQDIHHIFKNFTWLVSY